MQRFDAAATERLLDYPTLMTALTTVLREYALQEITSPERLVLSCGKGSGVLLSMPCQAHDLVAHKLLTIYKGNKTAGLPTIQGDVTCFNAATGVPLFSLDAATATARRTAAITMLGIQCLRSGPLDSCLLIGTGTQAYAHARAALELHPSLSIHVSGRTPEAATLFCNTINQPGRVMPATPTSRHETSLVIAITTSATPVFDEAADPARVVIGVGAYRPDMVEIGATTIRGSQVYVDDIVGAPAEAGDLLAAGTDWSTVRPLAAALDQAPDMSRPVFFKSVGCAAWDLAACRTAQTNLENARK